MVRYLHKPFLQMLNMSFSNSNFLMFGCPVYYDPLFLFYFAQMNAICWVFGCPVYLSPIATCQLLKRLVSVHKVSSRDPIPVNNKMTCNIYLLYNVSVILYSDQFILYSICHMLYFYCCVFLNSCSVTKMKSWSLRRIADCNLWWLVICLNCQFFIALTEKLVIYCHLSMTW